MLCLEKVYKKIHFKEYHFIEQSLCKLEAKEVEVAKTGSNLTIVEIINTLGVESSISKAYWLLLTNLFTFDLSFFQLPNLLFYNTP